jgi:hypothetical protein
MKRLLTAIILLLTFQFCFSQDIIGTWYMVNRSGLIEFSITKDSIKTRQLFTDFTPKGKPAESYAYINIVKLNDRRLVIRKSQKQAPKFPPFITSQGDTLKFAATKKSQDDTLKFKAMTITNLVDKKYFQWVWNVEDTLTNDFETLIQIHTNDNRPLFGYYVFSEHYIDSLKQMKSIDSLSVSDFKKYLAVYLLKIKLTEQDEVKYNKGYFSGFTYNFQLISQSLYDIGFNPLQNTGTIDPVYKKYYEDPEVKKILEGAKRK